MLLPENLARRYGAVPLRFLEDGSVLVAVADPTNVVFSDELRLALGVPVRVGVAAADAIELAITRPHEASDDRRSTDVVTDDSRTPTTTPTTSSTSDHEHAGRPSFINRSSRRPSTSAPRTSTSRRRSVGLSSAPASTASCARSPRSRAHSTSAVDEPAQDHGPGSTSRSAALPQDGRVSIRHGRTLDRRPRRHPADDARREGDAAHPAQPVRSTRCRSTQLGMWPRSRVALEHAISRSRSARSSSSGRPARARRRRSTPVSRCSTTPERSIDDDRGPGRVPGGRPRSDRDQPAAPASPSRPGCGRSCARTPTCSSSARSATRRRPRSRSAPR